MLIWVVGWVGCCFEGIGLWMGWTYAKIFGGPCPHVVASQSCASHNFQASFPSFFFLSQKKRVIKSQIIFICKKKHVNNYRKQVN
jgi:hypothetical protein